MSLNISEDRLQQNIFCYHWNNYPKERGLLFCVFNNPKNKIQGAQLKSKGMMKGVSDLIYLKPGGKPLLLELKTDIGKQSKAQKDWQDSVTVAGYDYYVIRTLEEAKKICGWQTTHQKN